MTAGDVATFAALVLFCGVVVFYDLHAGRVPNFVNLLGFLAGITTGFVTGGAGRFGDRLLGSLLGIGILLIPFLLYMVGAGDVKFLGAAGAIVGWRMLGASFLAGAAIGAMYGVFLIFSRFKSWLDLTAWLAPLLVPGAMETLISRKSDGKCPKLRLPYAVPLSLGLILCAGLRLQW